MPEGDTIHRSADRLRPALVGRALVRLEAPHATGRPPLPGTEISAVDAEGKHLRIRFADGTALRTHLRMSGSWHLYRPGERWQKPAHLARAVVEVDDWVAVCFSAPIVAFERDGAATAHLGPDLTHGVTDAQLDEIVARMDALLPGTTPIGVALLDQRIAAGVGNVFKSEVLFLRGVDPFAPLSSLDDATKRRLMATASSLLRTNALNAGPRVTYAGGHAVYGREGQPCKRCGTVVRRQRQGEQGRSTYWCPSCQPARAEPRMPTSEAAGGGHDPG